MLVCYNDSLCWYFMIIAVFSFLWLFALLVFHDNLFFLVSYDYLLCWCFMMICFPLAILTPTATDLPIPQTHYYGMNRGLFDIGNIDSQAHGFRKWKYSWGLSHTTCMLLIEVSYFYSISMKFETNPSFFILLILNLPESFQNFFDGFGYFQTQD